MTTEREEKKDYWERLAFEHELINRRLTWLLTSQTILFAAYAFSLDTQLLPAAASFRGVTAMSGLVIAALILVGVLCAIVAKRAVWKDYESSHKGEQFGVRTRVTYVALVPDTVLPVVFIAAWAAILVARS